MNKPNTTDADMVGVFATSVLCIFGALAVLAAILYAGFSLINYIVTP